MNAWILVANASRAAIYSSENVRMKDMVLVKEFEHPESREKGSDLVSDRPGHYQVGTSARSAYEKSDPKEIEASNFALELAQELQVGHNEHAYEQLIVVASPQFYGMLNGHMKFNCAEFVHIPKDYTKLKLQGLQEKVVEFTFGA